MKRMHKFLAALLLCAMTLTVLCFSAGATTAPATAETPAKRQEVLDIINAERQKNGLAAVVEPAEADAQADKMAALYFSTDDGDAYDKEWAAILDTEVAGKVSVGDCYAYKLKDGGWEISKWNEMDLLPAPAYALLQNADVTMVGIAFPKEGGVIILPY